MSTVVPFLRVETLNLVTGEHGVVPRQVVLQEEAMTKQMKQQLGECDCACMWTQDFGWVPECGCPVHDPDG